MKMLVETTGPFQLLDYEKGEVVRHDRPTVMTSTHFLGERAAIGQLEVLRNDLPDSASDEEWALHWGEAKGDRELALASFYSVVFPEVVVVPPAGGKKK